MPIQGALPQSSGFMPSMVYMYTADAHDPTLRVIHPLFLLILVCSVCVTVSALCMGSSTSFQIPHVCVNICFVFPLLTDCILCNSLVYPHLYKWPSLAPFYD